MTDDLLSVIAERMSSFSKGQRSIAEYILQSYDKAAFLTANALGKTVKVSESTVVRFSYLLGFDGYPQFQQALQSTVLMRFHTPQQEKSEELGSAKQDLLTATLREDAKLLRRTAEQIDQTVFEAAAASLVQARRVYLLGSKAGGAIAIYLQTYLQLLLENVRLITASEKQEIAEHTLWLSPQDMLLAVRLSDDNGAAAYGLSLCKRTGAKSILLTDSATKDTADYLLCVQRGADCLAPSPTALMSLACALVAALEESRKAETAQALQRLQALQDGE